ncbi:hypothetical protein EYF80_030848 [Liparis tanakae]|uniref:Uncharacterized protein n=1 Tax=Liparis tanakae TaxID=230148 RepID=A0A4Z2H0R1_9TELE|nr:hypothetical protein EYF80_030848 [Liparis tanakae]
MVTLFCSQRHSIKLMLPLRGVLPSETPASRGGGPMGGRPGPSVSHQNQVQTTAGTPPPR